MLKTADKELIEYIKKFEKITIDIINDVRDAYYIKIQENNIKFLILDSLPQTRYVEKLINSINIERDYWLTIVGYWVFKKLKEELPDFNFHLPEEEPKLIDYIIVRKMKATILEGESKVIDVVSINDDLGVVKENKRIMNATGNLRIKDIQYLYMTESVYHTINKLLNEQNINQRLKKVSSGKFDTIININYNNPSGPKIYSNYSPKKQNFCKYTEMEYLWLIDDKAPLRLFEVSKEGFMRENNNFDSIVNNERKRKEEQLRLERINRKFQCQKK